MKRRTIRARTLATLDRDVIDDGYVVIQEGAIAEIGPVGGGKSMSFDLDIDGLLMPGLVNRHTHLELTSITRNPVRPASFVEWLLWLSPQIGRPSTGNDEFARQRSDAVRAGIEQSLRFGVTEVWDISQFVQFSRPILAESEIRSISFGECLGIGSRRERFDALLSAAVEPVPMVPSGISPHAPYTVDERGYAMAFEQATRKSLPVMTHLAETPDEERFLLDHSGSFGALYSMLGMDPGSPPRFAGSPIEWLRAIKGDAAEVWLAHVNYASDDDLQHLRRMNAKVVWCPRTHQYFGHPPHRWQAMRKRGIEVYVGTDSCASSPDLNLLEDLRLLYQQAPEYPMNDLWRMASRPLLIGGPASLISFQTRAADPLRKILEDPPATPTIVNL